MRPFTHHADLNDEMDSACKHFLNDQDPKLHGEATLTREKISVWLGKRR
jgi:hypothetical protein